MSPRGARWVLRDFLSDRSSRNERVGQSTLSTYKGCAMRVSLNRGKCKTGVPIVRHSRSATLGLRGDDAPVVLLLDNPHLDLGLHIGMQPDANAIDAERLDRLIELDLALFDLVALCFELVCDVGRGD